MGVILNVMDHVRNRASRPIENSSRRNVMSNISTQLDPTLRSVESLEFEIELRNIVVGQEEAARWPACFR